MSLLISDHFESVSNMVDYTKAITAEKNFEKLLFSFERFAVNSLGCAINGHREARSSVQESNCCLVLETHSQSRWTRDA